jgi:hypothetical protein
VGSTDVDVGTDEVVRIGEEVENSEDGETGGSVIDEDSTIVDVGVGDEDSEEEGGGDGEGETDDGVSDVISVEEGEEGSAAEDADVVTDVVTDVEEATSVVEISEEVDAVSVGITGVS